MHAFKQNAVDQKALGLQYSTYHCYTRHKISVLVVRVTLFSENECENNFLSPKKMLKSLQLNCVIELLQFLKK